MLFGFFIHILTFSIIQFGGIYLAEILSKKIILPVPTISLLTLLSIFAIITIFMFLMIRFVKKLNFFKYFFYLIILVGSKTVFSAFYTNTISSILALGLLILFVARKSLIIHNVSIALAIIGVSVNLGLTITTISVISLMAIFSIYDILAVYSSKYMVNLFNKLSNQGVILALVLPKSLKGPKKGKSVFILGTGDIAFPLLLSTSLITFSTISAKYVAIGSIIGAAVVYILLNLQKIKRPMPALPPIAIGSIIGLIVSLI